MVPPGMAFQPLATQFPITFPRHLCGRFSNAPTTRIVRVFAGFVLFLLGVNACSNKKLSPSPASSSSAVVSPSSGSVTPTTPTVPSPAVSAVPPTKSVREEKTITVRGQRETIRLEWTNARLAGVEVDGEIQLFPLTGRIGDFGETGELSVVRERPGAPTERVDLGVMQLPRWPRFPDDADMMPSSAVIHRPEISAIQLGDYNHDGDEAEFPLLEMIHSPGTFAEDRREILVGIHNKTGRLTVIGDARWADKPVTMNNWGPLISKNPAEIVQSPCGDHGRSYEKTYFAKMDKDGLHITVRTYDCIFSATKSAQRGKRLSEQDWEPDEHGVHGTYPNYFHPTPAE